MVLMPSALSVRPICLRLMLISTSVVHSYHQQQMNWIIGTWIRNYSMSIIVCLICMSSSSEPFMKSNSGHLLRHRNSRNYNHTTMKMVLMEVQVPLSTVAVSWLVAVLLSSAVSKLLINTKKLSLALKMIWTSKSRTNLAKIHSSMQIIASNRAVYNA